MYFFTVIKGGNTFKSLQRFIPVLRLLDFPNWFSIFKINCLYWWLGSLLVILSSCRQLLCHGHRGQLLRTNHRCDTENPNGDTSVKTRTRWADPETHKKRSSRLNWGETSAGNQTGGQTGPQRKLNKILNLALLFGSVLFWTWANAKWITEMHIYIRVQE